MGCNYRSLLGSKEICHYFTQKISPEREKKNKKKSPSAQLSPREWNFGTPGSVQLWMKELIFPFSATCWQTTLCILTEYGWCALVPVQEWKKPAISIWQYHHVQKRMFFSSGTRQMCSLNLSGATISSPRCQLQQSDFYSSLITWSAAHLWYLKLNRVFTVMLST